MTGHPTHAEYASAVEFLYSLRWFGAKFGLENTYRLAALAGDPQKGLRFIHVAGTNGKGSTCAILESIYRAAGLRTGLFTSPHLVSFRERIQVNREWINESEVVELVARLRPLVTGFPADHHPTFFEVVTVMALLFFANRNCDLVIWETGLGGRLDATNIVTPVASVITNVQFDHQKWLGETLTSIAREKAGIIKHGVPIITGTERSEALGVIAETARAHAAPLVHASSLPGHLESRLPLRGAHQRQNAAIALATVAALQDALPVSQTAIDIGFENVSWPGRFQVLAREAGRTIILDGAHNIAGAEALASTFREQYPGARATLILGILRDKDWKPMVGMLSPVASRILLPPVQNERTAFPEELAELCRSLQPSVPVQCHATVQAALEAASDDPLVILTGSLYLVGEALELLQKGRPDSRERALNEWSPATSHERSP